MKYEPGAPATARPAYMQALVKNAGRCKQTSVGENIDAAMAALRHDFPALAGIDLLLEQQQRILMQRGLPMVSPRPKAKSAWDVALLAAPLLAGVGSSVAPHSRQPRQAAGGHVAHYDGMAMTPSVTPAAVLPARPEPALPPLLPDRMLPADWIATLDLNAFDDIAFFQECGETIERPASPEQRLAAAYRCLKPTLLRTRCALSIEGLDRDKAALFFRRLLPALGLGTVSQQGLDPAFAQSLFQRWFLSLALSSQTDGDDGAERLALHDLLLGATHAGLAAATICAQGEQPAASLRMKPLHDSIAAQFAQENPALPPAVRQWVLASLLAVFEPTLVRPDLPWHLRYGSLEWGLLDIGIHLAGMQHFQYNHEELIGLAVAAEVFDASHDADQEVAAQAVPTVLRMAHAAGAIDLRDTGADAVAALETAIALFQTQMHEQHNHPLASAAAGLPVRREVASAMLKERGLDPARQFMLSRPDGYGRDLLSAQTKELPCLDFDKSYALVDFFMAGCTTQLFLYGNLPRSFAEHLHANLAALPHSMLNIRFRREFDAAFDALADGVFADALDASVARMNARDRHFWRCGKASIRIPEATIITRMPPRPNPSASGAGRPNYVKRKDYRASGGLLVQLQLDGQTRDYWATLEPLTVARFDGDVAALLSKNLDDFFKTDKPEHQLSRLDPDAHIRYRTFENDHPRRAAQFAARHLLTPRLPQVREAAFQMTAPEALREGLYQSLLDLLPLRACIRSLRADESYQAAFFCGADALSLIPLLRAGIKVVGSAARAGAALSTAQSRKLALSLLTGAVERDIAPKVIGTTLRVGKPVLALGKQTAHWLNPVDGMAPGLSWLSARLAEGGRLLLRRLQKISVLERLAADVERSIARQRMFYPDRGFWHATPDAVTVQNGQRQLHTGGKTYLLIDMGERSNVVALQQGPDLRLANPESGLIYGPVLNGPAQAMPWLPPAHHARLGLCRVKRGGSEAQGCDKIKRATQFGKGIYSFDDDFRFPGVQMRVAQSNMGATLLPVDLNNIGFASYTMRRRAATLEPVYNSRYFAFNEEVWIAQRGQLRRASIDCPFPERIRATVIYAARTDNAQQPEGADYLMFDIALPAVTDDPENYFNRFIVPYGNYPGRNGACMGMIEIPGGVYKFHVDDHWAVRLPPGREVILSKATQRDYSLFEKYQQINVGVRVTPDAFRSDSLRQLRQLDDPTQRRFDAVLKRAEEMLIDAERALHSRGWQVGRVLQRFMPAAWSAARKQSFITALAENIQKVRSALPMVKRDKLDVIGLGEAYRVKSDGASMGADENYARAEALSGSMALDMHLMHIRRALIYFDEQHFATAAIDELASDLVHEMSHARYRSRDTISEASTARVYPNTALFDQNLIDIAPLVAAAAQDGSDSINHASTFEHLVVTLAYTQSDETIMLLHSFFNGGMRYSRKADDVMPECVAGCGVSR